MHEQRDTKSGEVRMTFVAIPITPDRIPRTRRDWMCRRTDCQQIQNQIFAVGVPTSSQKACFGFPAMRQKSRITVEHTANVDPLINLCCQSSNLEVVAQVLPCSDHSSEE